ncbi:MAG: cobS [Actinomycetia bacterium]|nr:cobS [Actinomycetes bacterium]
MRQALGFLTPFGGASAPTPQAVRWFPVVGILVGLAVGGVWRGAEELWPPALAAALAVVADLALTGMLHVDGLVDSADGLLPHLSRERRLAVMSEPTVGAFGVVVAAAVLLLRWAALASMGADVWLVAGLWCLSRTAMVGVMAALPYARETGLASVFAGTGRLVVVAAGAVAAATLIGVGVGWPALAVVSVAGLAVMGIAALAHQRLGGFTGDVLGAAGMLAETVGLVVAAARW